MQHEAFFGFAFEAFEALHVVGWFLVLWLPTPGFRRG